MQLQGATAGAGVSRTSGPRAGLGEGCGKRDRIDRKAGWDMRNGIAGLGGGRTSEPGAAGKKAHGRAVGTCGAVEPGGRGLIGRKRIIGVG